tara:strand:+ start:18 stop:209 length:192 start_codon:yes stop_codon:yes gene_type:complete
MEIQTNSRRTREMNIPFDEALLHDREPDNDVILDNLYEKYLNRGYAPEVAERMALDEFDRIGV